jgi:hypothetical protein
MGVRFAKYIPALTYLQVDVIDPEASFRPLCESDFQLLTDWLCQPHIMESWARDNATP